VIFAGYFAETRGQSGNEGHGYSEIVLKAIKALGSAGCACKASRNMFM